MQLKLVKGAWCPGKVPGGTPVSAVAFGDVQLQVFWRNLEGEIVVSKNTGSQWGPTTRVLASIAPGFQFSVLQWEEGKYLRLYYQNEAGLVLEHYSDNGGLSWNRGALQVGGTGE